jgi:sugar lactone lactonase YvrE
MSELSIDTVCDVSADLGEGPYWDAESKTLLWVDIWAGLLHRTDTVTGDTQTTDVGAPTSLVLPAAGGGVVLARNSELILLDATGGERVIASTADPEGIRFNDGSVDPDGRVFVGSMDNEEKDALGQLYRLEPDGTLAALVTLITISNGIAWSPSGDLMYYVDSPTKRIDVFTYHPAVGGLADRRQLADMSDAVGVPDGLTVDAEGYVWVADNGGGALRRYAPSGVLDAVLPLPVSKPTSCAFGGDGLRELFITTARRGLSDAELEAQPLAGRLLRFTPGVAGLPATINQAVISG